MMNIPEVEDWRCPDHPGADLDLLHTETISEDEALR
jgi:hypothetical protein